MKILVATDKFKGTLSAHEACSAVKEGILKANSSADVTLLPLADGGEGSLDVIEETLKFKKILVRVTGPFFEPVEAWYGLGDTTAYIEMAKASGLMLLDKHAPHAPSTTTLGTGQLIVDALERGVKKIYLFVGGSATNDAGIGMAHALGFRFFNDKKELLQPIGASLDQIAHIEETPIPNLADIDFILVTDVKNPLFGSNGAAHVFARQKGANTNEIKKLDLGLQSFNNVVENKWGLDVSQTAGAGAAGGLGAGAMIFLRAKVQPGIETIMHMLNFNHYVKDADFVVSGEGKFDKQTLGGKVIKGVMDSCSFFNTPLAIVCGVLELDKKTKQSLPIHGVWAIRDRAISLDDAINNAYSHLIESSRLLTIDLMNYE